MPHCDAAAAWSARRVGAASAGGPCTTLGGERGAQRSPQSGGQAADGGSAYDGSPRCHEWIPHAVRCSGGSRTSRVTAVSVRFGGVCVDLAWRPA